MANGQRGVFVSAMGQGLIDKQMTRGTTNNLKHVLIDDAFVNQALNQPLTSTLGSHANTAMHQATLFTPHQPKPSSQPSRHLNASPNVRSSCNGVIDT
jgi:hypothetical protein